MVNSKLWFKKSEENILRTLKLSPQNKRRVNFSVAVVIVITMFVLFFIFNTFSGYAADDYLYFFKYAGHNLKGTPQRLTGIADIIAGMKVHYKICNGRIPAHFMLQLFALGGKTVFNVFNSFVFVLLGLLVYFHANIKGKLNIPLLIFVYAFEWFGTYLPATVYLWFSGSFNYLWTTTFVLAFLLIYRIYATSGAHPGPKTETSLCVITLIGGLLAGWSNENVGCAVVAAVVLFMLYYKRRKLGILPHHVCGLVGSIVGYLILMLAPGNRVRLGNTKYERIFYKHISWSLSQLAVNMFRVIGILVVAAIVVYIFSRVKKVKINWLLPGVYFVSGLISACILLLSPEEPARAFFGANMLLACSAFMLVSQVLRKKKSGSTNAMRRTAAVLAVFVAVFFAVAYTSEYYSLKYDGLNYQEVEQEIYEQKEAGQKNIVIKQCKPRKSLWSLQRYELSITGGREKNAWFNSWVAAYYGVDSITVETRPHWNASTNKMEYY